MIKLRVQKPCHQDWEAMIKLEQGRHCQMCQKTVTDFTMMSDGEILNYLANTDLEICGRFTSDQLDRSLMPSPRKYSLAYLWNFLLASLLTTTYANAQSSRPGAKRMVRTTQRDGITKKETIIQPRETDLRMGDTIVSPARTKPIIVKGTVLNSRNNAPVPYASLRCLNTGEGLSADSVGNFEFHLYATEADLLLDVSAIGFASTKYPVSHSNNPVQLYLDPEATAMEQVTVKAYPTVGKLSVRLGGAMGILSITLLERVTRNIDHALSRKNIKIYPNPVTPGSPFHLEFSSMPAGEYSLQVINEQGQLLLFEKIQLSSIKELKNFRSGHSWAKGIYWIRLSSRQNNKVFHAKMLLQ